MATRRRKIGLLLLGTLLCLGLFVVFVVPIIVERQVELKAKEVLAKQSKLDVTWDSLDLNWRGKIAFSNLQVKLAKSNSKVTFDQIELSAPLQSILDKKPQLDSISFGQGTLFVDVSSLKKEKKDPDKSKDPKGPKKPKTTLEDAFVKLRQTKPNIARLIDFPPEVSWSKGLDIEAVMGDDPVAKLAFEPGKIEKKEDGSLHTTLTAKLSPTYKKTPKFLRPPRTFILSGHVTPHLAKADLEMTGDQPSMGLFSFGLPRIGRTKIGSISLQADMLKESRANLFVKNGILNVGDASDPILETEAKSLGFDLLAKRRTLMVQGLDFKVNPRKLGEFGDLGKKAKQPLFKKIKKKIAKSPKKEGATNWKQKLSQLQSLSQRATRLMAKFDVELQESKLSLLFSPESGTDLRTIEVVNDLALSIKSGHISLTGTSAGGKLIADALFLPGMAIPMHASMDWQGVKIDALPGMSSSRTLPNRGVRGKLGGVVDLKTQLFTPALRMLRGGSLFEDAITLETDIAWRNGVVELHGLADEPLEGIELDTKATLVVKPSQQIAWLRSGSAQYNGLDLSFGATFKDWSLRPLLLLEVGATKPTPCQTFADAMPDAMLGPYDGIKLKGEAQPVLKFRYPLNDPDGLTLDLWGMSKEDKLRSGWRRWRRREDPKAAKDKDWGCKITGLRAKREGWPDVNILSAPGTPGQAKAKRPTPSWRNPGSRSDVYWMNRPFVKKIESQYLSAEDVDVKVGPGLATYTPINSLPKHVPAAAYLSEEILFYDNRGISLGLIEKALRINLERGRFVYGGSTVTQQLVKNLFLTRHKTLARKLQEALISLRIDEVVSKDRVLELYLNCIEFGPDLYGIGPAAQHYFGKPAKDLTPMEAVFLAVIKPSPKIGARIMRRGSIHERSWLRKRIKTIFRRMVEHEILNMEEAKKAQGQELLWDKVNGYSPTWAPGSQEPSTKLLDLFDAVIPAKPSE